MPRGKEKLYLNKFEDELKNPAPNKYVLVYTENEDEAKPVNKPKDRITLRQVVDMMNARIDDLERNINARIDKIEQRLDYNNLKRLPDSK